MTIDKEINVFEKKIISDVNGSNLSPAIVRLVLNEVLASVKEIETNNLAKESQEEEKADKKANSSSSVSKRSSK